MRFGLVVIGDEILSGKREDKHFSKVVALLSARGLRLSWASYQGDDRTQLTEFFRRTLASDEVVFSCGGIGNTPDDHTRQAVAAALGVPLALHPDAEREIKARFKDELTPERALLGTFPAGCDIVPNPFNRIPGFSIGQHYFVPGFPQMAWPMIEWALDTHFSDRFVAAHSVDKAFLLSGENAYESALLGLMERVVMLFPDVRLFSLPSMGSDQQRRHLELGVEGELTRVDAAMEFIRQEIEKRGINWRWRDDLRNPS